WLFVDGARAVMSFGARWSVASPLSPKIVAQGLVVEQVPPLVTKVSTSENSPHPSHTRQLLIIRGVMKMRSSVLVSLTESRLNSHLSSGICPRTGVRSVCACSVLT